MNDIQQGVERLKELLTAVAYRAYLNNREMGKLGVHINRPRIEPETHRSVLHVSDGGRVMTYFDTLYWLSVAMGFDARWLIT